jgi:hypothetical protein
MVAVHKGKAMAREDEIVLLLTDKHPIRGKDDRFAALEIWSGHKYARS